MNKKPRPKKQPTLQRAAPQIAGGALMYLSPQQLSSLYGQMNYRDTNLKNAPSTATTLFNPGYPLPTQANVNADGLPVAWKFPPQFNVFPVDRSLGNQDIPSFEQLRNLARLYDGCNLCMRYWLDLVPRMSLDIRLKKVFKDAGADEKNYQNEIKFFKNFFDKPDGKNDTHTWLRMALTEQTQIDALCLYLHGSRGGRMLRTPVTPNAGIWIVSGDQIKPLLDDWGMQPDSPKYAYQQYPWGVPGMKYTSDQMIYYRESPVAYTPYGFSRVEGIIMRVNQALRKQKKDLSHWTEGNIPQAFMEVPADVKWTPDDIDSFAQSFNAMLAGNAQQQVRLHFLQPGMKYVPAEQYDLLTDADLFLFKVTCAMYGIPPSEFGFIQESSLSSSGESQEDVVYRRTIEPLALVYSRIFTGIMGSKRFPPDMHGEMFEAVLSGYEEVDDEKEKAETLTTYTGAGVLGLSAAARLAGLPEDPDAKPIGRVYMSKDGPVFLDDMASDEMRKAATQARLAGFQMAANPPEPQDENDSQEGDDQNEQGPPQNTKGKESTTGDSKRGNSQDANRAATSRAPQSRAAGDHRDANNASDDYRKWRSRAIDDVKAGKPPRPFTSSLIPEIIHAYISMELERCLSRDDVAELFERVQTVQQRMEVIGS